MYTTHKLVDDLKGLLSFEVKDSLSLSQWYLQAKIVVKNIRSSAEISNTVTEDVWHYLSDADVRFKDASVKYFQEKKVIAFIEREVASLGSISNDI